MSVHSKTYATPANLVDLLDGVVAAASGTTFYRSVMGGCPAIGSLADFERLPITAISNFRRRRLAEVIADPDRVQWIVGRHGRRDRGEVPVAEGVKETATRYELLKDAIGDAAPDLRPATCAIITDADKRYFAAEVSTILGYMGVPAHVFAAGSATAYHRVHQVEADLLVILTDELDESRLPPSVRLCLTFRRSHKLDRFRQLDLYMVDELGFLGHSTDLEHWVLYNDQYLFEQSQGNKLVVTALHNQTQPLLRLETHDTVAHLGEHSVALESLCRCG